ncbi:PDR/VanB family oxidoreductase [Pseudoduganella namucuonensis]|uniref:Vanillate O-demethylase ferredoxin subunit n=1 Tax=Pseudoduganella namucuonensis TaxID=1035707 RepID=A0A1I7LZX4_9BURK|nr:PDR/VanB family oxidoreductase [Pseudoduganella namucuonensis]SFV15090.1 vanillate O-demethylase ferredoxin subunit [Pseudoduganella namucuonensis]
MKLIVEKIVDETPDVRSFRLVRADGAPLARYEAGAHVDVTAPGGVTRQYSLCGSPGDAHAYTIAVKREAVSRGGSQALHERVSVRTELEVGAPRNLFALDPDAGEHVLFGAGIGITPLLAMAHQLIGEGKRFTLHYFTRAPEHTAFADLLGAPPFAHHVRFHYGVQQDAMAHYLDACMNAAGPDAHVYTCGPAPFMDAVVRCAARSRGEDAIHLEHFQAGAPAASSAGGDGPFEVQLAGSGRIVPVPAGTAIVDALAAIGVAIDTSCREGICGTCVVPLLEGEPDHRDNCLSKKEKARNDQICLCVSRARSARLVLDL